MFFLLALIIFLIIFAPQAATGAKNGLLLWFNNVLPVLFPFSFLLQIIMSADTLAGISRHAGFPTRRLLHLSPFCSFCILAGFLCGFPMGAVTASQALKNKQITRDEAQILSAVCNHASPMFLTGYILHQVLSDPPFQHCLILIFYISPFSGYGSGAACSTISTVFHHWQKAIFYLSVTVQFLSEKFF